MRNIPLAQPEITQSDIDEVNKVLKSNYLSRGPKVSEFENQICKLTGSTYACAVSSGTAGLIMALQSLGVGVGDEVITPSFTVPATVNSIVAIGAIPVMVDIETDTYGIDPQAVELAINDKTKAIIIVHVFGKSAKTKEILKIAKENQLKVIEDACEAIGNTYKGMPLGSLADIGVYAFYPNKQITTGEGGMLVTNDEKLHHKFELLRNHGRSMNGDLFDQTSFGWNFRLSDINAALGLSQLKRIEAIKKKRIEISGIYNALLRNNSQIICPEFSEQEVGSAWFVYVVRLTDGNRDIVWEKLKTHGIQCGRYFAPVHLQPYYRKKFPDLTLKNTEEISSQSLALPFYTGLLQENMEYICDKLLKTY